MNETISEPKSVRGFTPTGHKALLWAYGTLIVLAVSLLFCIGHAQHRQERLHALCGT